MAITMTSMKLIIYPLILPCKTTHFSTQLSFFHPSPTILHFSASSKIMRWAKSKEEQDLQELPPGLPPQFYDDEWQAKQRLKTQELNKKRQEEDDEEERKVQEYREIGTRLKGFPDEEVMKARRLVSSFIRAEEQIEEKIEEAAERGELDELVLMVIWNRLDLARRDNEKDAIRSLDLLYRRVEAEILKREATPAMRLLNDLLNMHDGFDDEVWLKDCKKRMIETFPREDPFSIIVPAGFDIDKHEGPLRPPLENDEILMRVDFIREVDELLQEVRAAQKEVQPAKGLDPESVATRMKQQEKLRTIRQVESLLQLALNLQW
ncbi:hypothetical protein RND81_04G195200 [Saponaria officinalis]|uniref:Protein PALE CRESS, chloroplastic n=1 Tax=Saponaria officinalis TaxID=3572 RepID=A0AAW1LFK7_SAPOF